MKTLVKTAIVAAPALVLVIYLWGSKSAQYEAQISEDSAAIDKDFARINESVEKDPALKREWQAEKLAAHKRYSSAKIQAVKAREKSQNDNDELRREVNEMNK